VLPARRKPATPAKANEDDVHENLSLLVDDPSRVESDRREQPGTLALIFRATWIEVLDNIVVDEIMNPNTV
jgi:hypothetical protein